MSVRENLQEFWDYKLPKNINLVNYALNYGRDGGEYYYVFDYNGNDENFNNSLTYEKDENFEKNFSLLYKSVKDYFKKEYNFPDLSKDYFWDLKTKADDSTSYTRFDNLYILCFTTNNQLIILKSFIDKDHNIATDPSMGTGGGGDGGIDTTKTIYKTLYSDTTYLLVVCGRPADTSNINFTYTII